MAAGLPHKPHHRGKTEAAAAAILGAEKRLKRPRRHLSRHAGSGIAHGDRNKIPGFNAETRDRLRA
jgi:hypothetical protein